MITNTKKAKVAIGGIWHETNAFASSTTSMKDFEIFEGQAILEGFAKTRTPIGGFLDWNARQTDIDVMPAFFASAVPSGMVSRDTYETFVARLVESISQIAPDIILLDLHGAMAVEGLQSVEADILRRLRAKFGTVPMGAVLDFHANISAEFIKQIDIVAGYDTYPHTDHFERGVEVAELTLKTLRRDIHPTRAICQPPLMIAPQAQYTDKVPMATLMQGAFEAERIRGVLSVTIAGGFPYSDVKHAGLSIVVTTDNNQELAQTIASEIGQQAWDMRERFAVKAVSPIEAVLQAMKAHEHPQILVDSSDNIGGGAPGDGTVVLKELLQAKAGGAVISITDPEALKRIIHAGIGGEIFIQLGGKTDAYHGSPVEVRGKVLCIRNGDFNYRGSYMTSRRVIAGMTAVLDADGVIVVVRELKVMPFDSEELRVMGIEPSSCRIIVVKSAIAWRAAYGEMAKAVIEVDTPGICSSRLASLPFKNVRRPIAPLDAEVTWSRESFATT